MDYARFIKKFNLPTYLTLVAKAICREHLGDDVRGINANIALIQRTGGGGWPTEPVSEEFNYVDLVWHEQEFPRISSFTYALYDSSADGR